ncbi:MAG: PilZ domain-containing protein [Spirochaetes bacterium]|nr:PilZ domain-containing protein [Spirochaetota bacterium]MBU1080847.1 PilZ domain-containing protein [Spirochaetota bacterium]
MKALIVVEDDAIAEIVRFYLQPLGLDVIHYKDPLKALDNLEEISPDAVVMSAKDFPRHWKTIVVDIRASRPKAACVIVLLKGDYFPFEEAAKAAYLGVNGVVKEDLSDKAELERFQQLLKRYIEIDDSRVSDRLAPGPSDRLGFVFAHPASSAPIIGTIETISSTGLSFIPEAVAAVADLEPGVLLEDASLRVDAAILPIGIRLLRTGAVMAFSFECSDEERAIISSYIAGRVERELRSLLNR